MEILGFGLDLEGRRLFEPIDEEVLSNFLLTSLETDGKSLQALGNTLGQSIAHRGEMKRTSADPADPRTAGWTVLMNKKDQQCNEILTILEPLANHRGMSNPKEPLLYNGESSEEWLKWLNENYYVIGLEQRPQYILIVGNPQQVPFRFQSVLNAVANVGRVDFDTLDDLHNYIQKLIRIETAEELFVSKETILFAPDAGMNDPTYFSREYMIKPLAEHITNKLGFKTHTISGDDASKAALLNALTTIKPALVYTASHGLGAKGQPFEFQKRYNGAIWCKRNGLRPLDSLFTAEDVPVNIPFLEGSVFFQFACFGYGTPQESDYAHWLKGPLDQGLKGIPKQYTDSDFIAALPKKLLAHPKGPIAFIGHLDTAFIHGFAETKADYNPQSEELIISLLPFRKRWNARIAPFVNAVNQLLKIQPPGLSMRDMNTRYAIYNASITNTYDQQRRGKLKWNKEMQVDFLDEWISRNDAQNYMIFGDPATHLRIPG